MNKIALTAVAILVATGSAFAGSDHFSAPVQHAVAVDTTTASIVKLDRHDMKPAAKIAADEPGQGIWGR
ncbi:DUF680 domain-containing protein [Mesorhizobium sp.]|uniref:DUF680 domain-containing protein n=1 Tax=Mesorhizobium sp. TaxID=1871066 RepID=UPI000FE9B452|nr:DUF680 domain-containing protein [Mesorhizobium sp.]RWE76956.1 MAG: DUF680 domain-containing protein [Mesorhizobium sp.]TIV30377.1 MAG: DUF680 domain-containing protein [Mesorhizobium sp.]